MLGITEVHPQKIDKHSRVKSLDWFCGYIVGMYLSDFTYCLWNVMPYNYRHVYIKDALEQ